MEDLGETVVFISGDSLIVKVCDKLSAPTEDN